MKTIHEWLKEYAVSHQNETNKLVHWICVPLIFFSIICLLAAIPHEMLSKHFPEAIAPYIHWGTVGLVIAWLFYLRLSFPLFLGILLETSIMLVIVHLLEQADFAPLWLIGGVIFIISWIFQFWGHKVEGQKPSFLKDIQFLLIGPAWVITFLYEKMGIKY